MMALVGSKSKTDVIESLTNMAFNKVGITWFRDVVYSSLDDKCLSDFGPNLLLTST